VLTLGIAAFLWLLLSAIPVILFYFLRMRFRQQPVSSTYIWNKFKDDLKSGSRLRWRTILLLILQTIALIMLVLALAKPSFIGLSSSKPGTCFLLDVSASMGALESRGGKDGDVTRLDAAKRMLSDEMGRLPRGTDMAVFICASYAKPLSDITRNAGFLKAKLKSVSVTDDEFLEGEVSQTVAAWQAKIRRKFNVVLITDGGTDFRGNRLSEAFDMPLKVIYAGTVKDNVGLNGLRFVNLGNADENKYQAQFYVRNTYDTARKIEVDLRNGQNLLAKMEINAEPGLTRSIVDMHQDVETGRYSAEIVNNSDCLAVDDRCYLSVNPKPQVKILVVGKPNPFINAALAYGNILFSSSDRLPAGGMPDNWDIIISNYVKLPGNVRNNLLTFGEVPDAAPVKYGRMTGGMLVRSDVNHPLLRYVDWENVRVSGSLSLSAGSGASVLSTVNGLPVLEAWEKDGYKYAACTVDIFNSDIGLSGSFPIFLQNFISWCVPQNDSQLKYTIDAGTTVMRYENASWRVVEKNMFDFRRQGNKIYLGSLKSGIYNWTASGSRGTISVNVPLDETDITPKRLEIKNVKINNPDDYRENIALDHIPVILFILIMMLEWFLWIGIPVRKRS
jgi:hypothetical protein